MKKQTHLHIITGLFLLSLAIIGCSLDNINASGGRTAGKEDLTAARQILSESLSSDQSGIILSLNDALTSVSESGFISATYNGDHSGRGNEISYTHAYHQENGMHVVSFKRQVRDALFNKNVEGSLHYRYRTSSGTNIKFPQQQSKNIASIYYDGWREGQITTLHKESHFVRQDTFLISGVNTAGLKINGVHHGSGAIQITPAGAPSFERTYELEINLLNITASPAALNNNSNFWKKVSGTLSWQLKISSDADAKKIGGTIKLSGAGIALLNINGSAQKYQVNLNNGDLKDRDEEFEGRITGINLAEQNITLYSGRTLFLTSDTEIEQETYTSLQAVSNATNKGIDVWAEGKGETQNGRFIVSEIEFEKEGEEQDDDGENRIEFEDIVSSVDVSSGVFTLFGKVSVAINEETTISDNGNYLNLQEVADALDNGLQISAEGEAISNNGTGIADITAIEVEFEKVDSNNSGEED